MGFDRIQLDGMGAVRAHVGAQRAFAAAAIVVAVAAVAEASNALGVVDNGPAPGQDYRFRGLLLIAAVSALLVVALGSPIIALSHRVAHGAMTRATVAFVVAAACLCVARFYAYDAYYAPSRIRFGGSDAFSPSFVAVAVGLDLVGAALLYRRPRLAFSVLFPGLMMSAFYVFAAGLGH